MDSAQAPAGQRVAHIVEASGTPARARILVNLTRLSWPPELSSRTQVGDRPQLPYAAQSALASHAADFAASARLSTTSVNLQRLRKVARSGGIDCACCVLSGPHENSVV